MGRGRNRHKRRCVHPPFSNVYSFVLFSANLHIGQFKAATASDSAKDEETNRESRTEETTATVHQTEQQTSTEGTLNSNNNPTVFVDVQMQSVIGGIWDNLFGGAGAGNAENFEGGNQGSYFDFMYPSDNDYPWACVCDEGQYAQWEAKQVRFHFRCTCTFLP